MVNAELWLKLVVCLRKWSAEMLSLRMQSLQLMSRMEMKKKHFPYLLGCSNQGWNLMSSLMVVF